MSVSYFFSCHVGLLERNREIVGGVTYDDETQQRWYPFLWRKETEYNIFYVFEQVKVGSCACGFVYSESIELRCQLSLCPFSEDTPLYSYEHVRCTYRSWFNMFWHDLGQWNHRIDHVAFLSSSSKCHDRPTWDDPMLAVMSTTTSFVSLGNTGEPPPQLFPLLGIAPGKDRSASQVRILSVHVVWIVLQRAHSPRLFRASRAPLLPLGQIFAFWIRPAKLSPSVQASWIGQHCLVLICSETGMCRVAHEETLSSLCPSIKVTDRLPIPSAWTWHLSVVGWIRTMRDAGLQQRGVCHFVVVPN